MKSKEILANIEKNIIKDITSKIHEYFQKLEVGTSDINNFTNINEIERNLYDIIGFHKNLYLDATSNILSSIDEKELIDQKK